MSSGSEFVQGFRRLRLADDRLRDTMHQTRLFVGSLHDFVLHIKPQDKPFPATTKLNQKKYNHAMEHFVCIGVGTRSCSCVALFLDLEHRPNPTRT